MVGFEARTQQGAALRPTSHFVYESIYTAILEKRLAPAAKLSKETLGQIFRVSNGTIQRALTRLAEDGAVVMPPKEVASVARPDERQARQVLDARLLVESEVVRQLPAGLDPAALAELRALVDEEQACLAARDSAGLIRLAGRFHLRLAELTENP
ncbi:GntR family transcriptional regulator, partial [Pseudomonas aeruginosa]